MKPSVAVSVDAIITEGGSIKEKAGMVGKI